MKKKDAVVLLQIGLLYGALMGLVFSLLSFVMIKNSPDGLLPNSWLLTITLFSVIIVVNLLAFRQGNRHFSPSKISFTGLLLISLSASAMIGLISGIDNYLISAVFEPEYLDRMMAAAEANWQARNYGPEIIVGQEEHKMYASPLNFAISGAKFMVFLNLFVALISSFFYLERIKLKVNEIKPTKLNIQ